MSWRIKALSGQWKRGWVEIPEVMLATCAGMTSFFGCIALYFYKTSKGPNAWTKKYNHFPIILRPEDPRVPMIKDYEGIDKYIAIYTAKMNQ